MSQLMQPHVKWHSGAVWIIDNKQFVGGTAVAVWPSQNTCYFSGTPVSRTEAQSVFCPGQVRRQDQSHLFATQTGRSEKQSATLKAILFGIADAIWPLEEL